MPPLRGLSLADRGWIEVDLADRDGAKVELLYAAYRQYGGRLQLSVSVVTSVLVGFLRIDPNDDINFPTFCTTG